MMAAVELLAERRWHMGGFAWACLGPRAEMGPVDADVLLRLEVGQRYPAGAWVGTCGLQVVDPDLQVPHHQLLAGPGRPDWWRVAVFGVEAQSNAAGGVARGTHPDSSVPTSH